MTEIIIDMNVELGEPPVLIGEVQCTICLECLNNQLKTLPCKHQFHTRCINKWLREKNTCPMCRRVIGQSIQPVQQIEQIERDRPARRTISQYNDSNQRDDPFRTKLGKSLYIFAHLLYMIPIVLCAWAHYFTEYNDEPHVCADKEEYACVDYDTYITFYLFYCGILFFISLFSYGANKTEFRHGMIAMAACTYITVIAGFSIAYSKQLGAPSQCGSHGGRVYPTCRDTLANNPVYFWAILSTTLPAGPFIAVGILACLGQCFYGCCKTQRHY
jgi:hypothetical protein